MTAELEAIRRPLTRAEHRALRGKMASLTGRSRRASRAAAPTTAAIVVVLWLWTLLASDASWLIVTGVWLGIGVLIGAWVHRDFRRDARAMDTMVEELESALRHNTAAVYTIRAHAFAELEELEDEGACYAFELDDSRSVFVMGQEVYPSAKFPSLDFSLVYPLNERGEPVEMLIDKRGPKAVPSMVMSSEAKVALAPRHLEVRNTPLRGLCAAEHAPADTGTHV